MKAFLLSVLFMLPGVSFAIPIHPGASHPELWYWVSKAAPKFSFRLSDGRGICLATLNNNSEWYPGYVDAECFTNRKTCNCTFYIRNTHWTIGEFWILLDSPLFYFLQTKYAGTEEALNYYDGHKPADLCVIKTAQTENNIPGYVLDTSNVCHAGGTEYKDFHLLFILKHSHHAHLRTLVEISAVISAIIIVAACLVKWRRHSFGRIHIE